MCEVHTVESERNDVPCRGTPLLVAAGGSQDMVSGAPCHASGDRIDCRALLVKRAKNLIKREGFALTGVILALGIAIRKLFIEVENRSIAIKRTSRAAERLSSATEGVSGA